MCGICAMVSFQPEHPADRFVLQQMNECQHSEIGDSQGAKAP